MSPHTVKCEIGNTVDVNSENTDGTIADAIPAEMSEDTVLPVENMELKIYAGDGVSSLIIGEKATLYIDVKNDMNDFFE